MRIGDSFTRRQWLSGLSLSCGLTMAGGGCSALSFRSQSPEDPVEKLSASVKLIGEVAMPYGMNLITVEAVSMVTNLPGTGSDPAPSGERSALIAEMQARGVLKPNEVLASPATDLVLVRGYLRPGIQKGDRFDVEVRVPARSECKSLRDGWLMETHLRQMAVLDAQLRKGKTFAIAQGAVLVDPSAKSSDQVRLNRGRVLGGGVSQVSRELGLVIKPDARNFRVSAQIGEAVNRRFHSFIGGLKQGMAKPKTDEFIELKLHPRYKDNVERYIRVVRSLPLVEAPTQQLARMDLLKRQLLDPITAASAALRLEAIGKQGVDPLRKGLISDLAEVRFYSAEALAYLDEADAAPVLGDLARDVPAFRAYALAALGAMDDFAAYEALRDLLSVSSAETRYGAFRAMEAMNSHDPMVRGEDLGGQFSFHVLDVPGAPMVHFTRSHRPEIVLFGRDQSFVLPMVVEAGGSIIVTAKDDADRVSVARFAVGQPDQKRMVEPKLESVIRAIVELGGTYPDVVQCLQQAKSAGALPSRLEIDALPQGGRDYIRPDDEPAAEIVDLEATESPRGIVVSSPLPDLFTRRNAPGDIQAAARPKVTDGPDEPEKAKPVRSFLGKIWSRGA